MALRSGVSRRLLLSPAAVNGGNYVILPTPAAVSFAADWAAQAVPAIKGGKHDQHLMTTLHGKTYIHCTNKEACRNVLAEVGACCTAACATLGKRCKPPRLIRLPPPSAPQITTHNDTDTKLLVRSFLINHYNYNTDVCGLNQGTDVPLIDLCDWGVMLLHPLCTNYQQKLTVLKHEGVWFVDDDTSKQAALACLRGQQWARGGLQRHACCSTTALCCTGSSVLPAC
jgi:hypothetical protein